MYSAVCAVAKCCKSTVLSSMKLFLLLLFLLSGCPQAEQELRMTQSEFDRQAEITRLLLEGVSSTHVRNPPLPDHYLLCKGWESPGTMIRFRFRGQRFDSEIIIDATIF